VNGGNGGRCSVIVISRKNSQVKFIDKVASLKPQAGDQRSPRWMRPCGPYPTYRKPLSLEAGLLVSCLLPLVSFISLLLPPPCTAHFFPLSFFLYPLSLTPRATYCLLNPTQGRLLPGNLCRKKMIKHFPVRVIVFIACRTPDIKIQLLGSGVY